MDDDKTHKNFAPPLDMECSRQKIQRKHTLHHAGVNNHNCMREYKSIEHWGIHKSSTPTIRTTAKTDGGPDLGCVYGSLRST